MEAKVESSQQTVAIGGSNKALEGLSEEFSGKTPIRQILEAKIEVGLGSNSLVSKQEPKSGEEVVAEIQSQSGVILPPERKVPTRDEVLANIRSNSSKPSSDSLVNMRQPKTKEQIIAGIRNHT